MYYKSSKNKYRNKKVQFDGIWFDSKKELARYHELKILEKAGLISDLVLQPPFELSPTTKWNGKTLRKRVYKADFMYIENGITVVEDVKGCLTDIYKLKRHLFLNLYPQYKFIET
jgi:hypothetical protein